MGKRKSRKKLPEKMKVLQPLDTQFDCPFCNHEKTCDVKIDSNKNAGKISCRICMAGFQTQTNHLSEPIDIFNDWIDACEEANK